MGRRMGSATRFVSLLTSASLIDANKKCITGGLMANGKDLASALFTSYEVLKKGNGVVSSGASTPTTATATNATKGAKK